MFVCVCTRLGYLSISPHAREYRSFCQQAGVLMLPHMYICTGVQKLNLLHVACFVVFLLQIKGLVIFLGTTSYAERNRMCRKTHSLLSLSLVALPCMCSHAHLGFLTETHEEMFPQTDRYVYTPPPACIRSYRKARTCSHIDI